MAAAQAMIGTKVTAVLGTNALGMDILNVAWNGITRPSIKSSHIATTGGDTFLAGEKTDWGTVVMSGNFNVVGQLPVTNFGTTVAETLTVTFNDGSTWAASGFLTEFDWDNPDEEMVTFSATFKVSGLPTLVPAV